MRSYRILNSQGAVAEVAPLCMEDAFSIAIIGSDPKVRQSANIPFDQSLASAEAFVKRRVEQAETELSATFAVISDEVVIGCCSLHSYSRARDEAEIAFWLARSSWGLGWGFAICLALVTIAKEKRHLTTLRARCLRSNRRAIYVLQKCGFQPAGIASVKNIRTYRLRLDPLCYERCAMQATAYPCRAGSRLDVRRAATAPVATGLRWPRVL
jgi:RimJ/RimL family protein N-acetyltransferase